MKRVILFLSAAFIVLAVIASSGCRNGVSAKTDPFVCPEGEPFAVRIVDGGMVQLAFNDTLCSLMCEMNSRTYGNPRRDAVEGYENIVAGVSGVEQAFIANPGGDVNPILYMRTGDGNVYVLRIMKLLSSDKDGEESFRCNGPLDYVSGAIDICKGYDEYEEPMIAAVREDGTKVQIIVYD